MSTQSLYSQRALRPEESAGQWNLFTGELEPIPAQNGDVPESGWYSTLNGAWSCPKIPLDRKLLLTKGFRLPFRMVVQRYPKNDWSLACCPSAQKNRQRLPKQPIQHN